MKRQGKTLRLAYQLFCYKNGKEVGRYAKQIKSRIIQIIEASSASEWKIIVTYQPGVYNSGTYNTKRETIQSLRLFTEPSLLDWIEGSEW